MLCNLIGVNYCLNSNYTKHLAQTLRPMFFYVRDNFHPKNANLVAPPK